MESFNRDLINYLLGDSQEHSVIEKASRLINKCEKCAFDLSFPSATKLDIWKMCAGKGRKEPSFNGLLEIEQEPHDCSFSKDFIWPISLVQIIDNNVFFKLDRSVACNSILKDVCSNGISVANGGNISRICINNCELQRKKTNYCLRQLNQLRVNQICLALGRLLSACNHNVTRKENACYLLKGMKCFGQLL